MTTTHTHSPDDTELTHRPGRKAGALSIAVISPPFGTRRRRRTSSPSNLLRP